LKSRPSSNKDAATLNNQTAKRAECGAGFIRAGAMTKTVMQSLYNDMFHIKAKNTVFLIV